MHRGWPPPRTRRDVGAQFILLIIFSAFFGLGGLLPLAGGAQRNWQWGNAVALAMSAFCAARAVLVLKAGPRPSAPQPRQPGPWALLLAATALFGLMAVVLLVHLPPLALLPVGGWLVVVAALWLDARRASK